MDVSPPRTVRTDVARGVDLLAEEPDLTAGIPDGDLLLARRVLLLSQVVVAPGPWAPEAPPDGSDLLGYLVTDGVLAHDVELAGQRSVQLLGPGDVVDPFRTREVDGGAQHGWRALDATRLAVLDHRFVAATRKWPALGVALHRRLSAQAARASVHIALSQLARVELRVLAMLWHLVDQWGVVTADGVVLDLRLTHQMLGELVGARRPTITLALKELAESGSVSRSEHGLLVLAHDSRRALEP